MASTLVVTPDEELQALEVVEALAYAVPRIPAPWRELVTRYVSARRAVCATTNTVAITLHKSATRWHIKVDGRPAVSFPVGLRGMEVIHDMIRLQQAIGPVDRPVALFLEASTSNPALTLIKQLTRARSRITAAGAPEFAAFLKNAIVVSKSRETIRYEPVAGYSVAVPLRYQGATSDTTNKPDRTGNEKV